MRQHTTIMHHYNVSCWQRLPQSQMTFPEPLAVILVQEQDRLYPILHYLGMKIEVRDETEEKVEMRVPEINNLCHAICDNQSVEQNALTTSR